MTAGNVAVGFTCTWSRKAELYKELLKDPFSGGCSLTPAESTGSYLRSQETVCQGSFKKECTLKCMHTHHWVTHLPQYMSETPRNPNKASQLKSLILDFRKSSNLYRRKKKKARVFSPLTCPKKLTKYSRFGCSAESMGPTYLLKLTITSHGQARAMEQHPHLWVSTSRNSFEKKCCI